jgi:PAS domain S-box-containing protein
MKNKYSKQETILLKQLFAGGLIIGLLFTAYILFTVYSTIENVPQGVNKAIYMHESHPSLFIAWLIPLILGSTAYYFATVFFKKKNHYEYKLEKKNNIITNNALFAKSIGEGDFEKSDFGNLNKDDLLTRSLIMMRNNLVKNREKETTNIWINEGKEIISDELRKHNDLKELSFNVIKKILDYCDITQGRFYIYDEESENFNLTAAYAYKRKKFIYQSFKTGEGLIGQAAYERLSIYRTEIPEGFVSITSGIITDKKPGSLFIMPLISESKVQGIIEIADIKDFIPQKVISLMEDLGPIIGQVLFSVQVNLNTEKLLHEAQVLAEELKENEEELQQNAEEMRMTHEELEKSNNELERQIQEVESAKTRLHSLLENASEIITIFDARGKIKYESPSAEKILGFNPEKVIGMNATERIPNEFLSLVKSNFVKLHKYPNEKVTYTFKHYTSTGSEIWMETTGKNMLDNPAIEGLIFNTRDITLQMMAEKDRRLKSQMQALSENSPDLIMRFGRKGKFHYANPKVEEYLPYKPEELLGLNIDEINISDEFRTFIKERINSTSNVLKKQETEFEIMIDSVNHYLKVSSIPEFNEEKELESILIVAHDISDIKAIEKEIIEKNLKLTESINYAQRIQTAILPKDDILSKYFSNSFIFYKARDVVSGDFPWFKQNENGIYLAAVDCTGHGVPGALLSFIGYFLLNDIVNQNPKAKAAEILTIFDKEVKRTLKQENGSRNTRDGMDIAFCQFSNDLKKLYFAGAHRPLYIQRGDELIHISGNRRAIGGITPKKKAKDFVLHEIDLLKNDRIFIFSDGLSDQFKEGSFEKFQEKQVRNIISSNPNVDLKEMHTIFAEKLANWQGNYRQIDDILLIGIQI